MSDERREPVMSGIRPEKDEMLGSNASIDASTRRPAAISSRPVIVKSKLAPIAFLLALTGLGLAGFVYWQFTLLQQTIEASNSRIMQLESQLEMTGDESTASLAAIQAKMKWADSEIRKLWGVAYDTNRKAIAQNKTEVVSLSDKLTKINTAFDKYKKSSSLEIKLMSELVDEQTSTVNKMEADSNNALSEINSLTKQVNDQEKRIQTGEQAIEAIDAFRRSVNADLLKLKNAVSAP